MPSYDDIYAQVVRLLTEQVKYDKAIAGETDFIDDLGLDSVQVMELVLHIEETFDISFPINVLPAVRTVSDLCTQLAELTNKRA